MSEDRLLLASLSALVSEESDNPGNQIGIVNCDPYIPDMWITFEYCVSVCDEPSQRVRFINVKVTVKNLKMYLDKKDIKYTDFPGCVKDRVEFLTDLRKFVEGLNKG